MSPIEAAVVVVILSLGIGLLLMIVDHIPDHKKPSTTDTKTVEKVSRD